MVCFNHNNILNYALLLGLLNVLDCHAQREEMDRCRGAFGPVRLDGTAVPGFTTIATVDNINFSCNVEGPGICGDGFCGVSIDSPGIWFVVEGTGGRIKASSCDSRTEVPTKFSVFTGRCSELRCVGGTSDPDWTCQQTTNSATEDWNTIATGFTFDTFAGQNYYILVQDVGDTPGAVWISFTEPVSPQNDNCVDASGPVPRDLTQIRGTIVDASLDNPPPGFCGQERRYPGVWYQFFGTGGDITVGACSNLLPTGFSLSVYNGATCDSLSCVSGTSDEVDDPDKCTFTSAFTERKLSTFTFSSRDRDRYYVLLHPKQAQGTITADSFRFYVDDGNNGQAGSGGTTGIIFESVDLEDEIDNQDQDDGKSSAPHVSKSITSLSCCILASFFNYFFYLL